MGKGKKKRQGKEPESTSTDPASSGQSQTQDQGHQPQQQEAAEPSSSRQSERSDSSRHGPSPAVGRGMYIPVGGQGRPLPTVGRGGPLPAVGRGMPIIVGDQDRPLPTAGRGKSLPAFGRGVPPSSGGQAKPPPGTERFQPSDSQGGPISAAGRGVPPPSGGQAKPPPGTERFQPSDSQGGPISAAGRGVPPPSGGQAKPPSGTEKKPVPQQIPVQKPGVSPASSKTSLSSKESSPQKVVTAPSVKQSIPHDVAGKLREVIPCRKDPYKAGTKGRPIFVETNMLSITLNKDFRCNAVHYDVTITPDLPKFMMRPVFEAFRRKHFPNRYPAFDGKKNAFSANDLPFRTSIRDDITIFDQERQIEKTFNVALQKVNEIDLSWVKTVQPGLKESEKEQIAIQALDIIIRQGPSMNSVIVGKSFFREPQGRVVSLSNGLDLWVGTFQSVVLGWKPYLNIDVAHKGFPTPQNVISLFQELCRHPRDVNPIELNQGIINRNEAKIEKYLSGLKIQFEIPGRANSRRTFTINGLGDAPAYYKFESRDGEKCTVQQYFEKEKGYKIRYSNLPCLWVGPKNKKIYLPPELCTIVAGQATRKKMDEQQTSNMIRQAATNTTIRKQKIMNGFTSLRLNDSPTMREEFRLSVQGQFEKVPARVLDAPHLMYAGPPNKWTAVNKGVWHAQNFLQPANLPDNSWTILNLKYRPDGPVNDQDLYNFQKSLQQNGAKVGMTIGKALTPFTTIAKPLSNVQHILNFFTQQKQKKLLLVIVIIPDQSDIYSKVKQITELDVGVLTQCLKDKTMQRLSPATLVNILLKINSKLNGVNHTFAHDTRPPCLDQPCIILGGDVTHPSPDAKDLPSIAAVAASHDPKAFKYNVEIRLQPPKTEIIQNLTEIVVKQLKYFYIHTKHKPLRLIFYRDGVSEGQLPQVMYHEINAIKQAFKVLEPGGMYNPPITFLVVQKRHHIRLFPTDSRNSDDRNFNVQAGTIVDTHITHPSHIDFYLVSHASIQGTARPTKYRCICNETNDSEDNIEQLTYYLCHMFSRCTRSVSYPAPTYYAHLAAFRARALTQNVSIDLFRLDQEQRDKLSLKINETMPMFFV